MPSLSIPPTACGGHAHVKSLIDNHAIELLMELLTIEHPKASGLKEQALWALGNIAIDSGEARLMLLKKQIINVMLTVIGAELVYAPRVMVIARDVDEPSLSAVKHVAWISSTLAGIKNDSTYIAAHLEYEELMKPLIFMLTEFLQSPVWLSFSFLMSLYIPLIACVGDFSSMFIVFFILFTGS